VNVKFDQISAEQDITMTYNCRDCVITTIKLNIMTIIFMQK